MCATVTAHLAQIEWAYSSREAWESAAAITQCEQRQAEQAILVRGSGSACLLSELESRTFLTPMLSSGDRKVPQGVAGSRRKVCSRDVGAGGQQRVEGIGSHLGSQWTDAAQQQLKGQKQNGKSANKPRAEKLPRPLLASDFSDETSTCCSTNAWLRKTAPGLTAKLGRRHASILLAAPLLDSGWKALKVCFLEEFAEHGTFLMRPLNEPCAMEQPHEPAADAPCQLAGGLKR